MLDVGVIEAFAKDHYETTPAGGITLQPLRGGLESAGISRAVVRAGDGRPIGSFVVKPLRGDALREYGVHCALRRSDCGSAAPRLLGFRQTAPHAGYEFLEWVEAAGRWPWKDQRSVALVLEQLARLHSCDPAPFEKALGSWDYGSELNDSARTTIDVFRSAYVAGIRVSRRPMLPTLGRVAHALPKIREQLAAFMGRGAVHGDAHPGNALIRKHGAPKTALLLDWGRARLGSPLEDVCSWVQSTAFWEPEARRRHDTLLVRYREYRGLAPKLSRDFRDACWLAAGCNAFAGALRYHLAVAADPAQNGGDRWNSYRAAADWLRIIRRADVCWRR